MRAIWMTVGFILLAAVVFAQPAGWDSMTPKEKAAYFTRTINAEWYAIDEARKVVKNDEDLEMLHARTRKINHAMHLLSVYKPAADGGGMPSVELENAILHTLKGVGE